MLLLFAIPHKHIPVHNACGQRPGARNIMHDTSPLLAACSGGDASFRPSWSVTKDDKISPLSFWWNDYCVLLATFRCSQPKFQFPISFMIATRKVHQPISKEPCGSIDLLKRHELMVVGGFLCLAVSFGPQIKVKLKVSGLDFWSLQDLCVMKVRVKDIETPPRQFFLVRH